MLAQIHVPVLEVGGEALGHHAAAVEDDDVVGHLEHQLGVLLDQHDRESLLLEPPDRRHHLGHELRRQALRRLVHQEHARVRHQGPADGEHLLLAAGERARDLAAALADAGEERVDRVDRPPGRASGAAWLPAGHREVLADGEAPEDPAPLRHQRHSLGRDGLGGATGHVPPEDRDAAAPGRQQPDRHAHRGGLAGAVAAEQPEEAALAEPDRHPVQNVAVPVQRVDVVERQRVTRQGRSPGSGGAPPPRCACPRPRPGRSGAR